MRHKDRLCVALQIIILAWTASAQAAVQDESTPATTSTARAPEGSSSPDASSASRHPSVLVLTAMAGWEHDSVSNATALFRLHAEYRGWSLTVSSNPDEHFMSAAALRRFDVIVFLLTSGPLFSHIHKQSFREYVDEGGAVVGIHSAVDTNRDWPFFLKLFGAEFVGHPDIQWARMWTADRAHPTTAFLPETWEIEEEFYNFAEPLRLDDKDVLLSVDEESYEGGAHGTIHPISWTRSHLPAGSRVWYTALGHTREAYSSFEWPYRQFQLHVALGVEWAANGTALARQRGSALLKDVAV